MLSSEEIKHVALVMLVRRLILVSRNSIKKNFLKFHLNLVEGFGLI